MENITITTPDNVGLFGRKILKKITFTHEGEWKAKNQAERYLSVRGLHYGSTSAMSPYIWIANTDNADYLPQKFSNIREKRLNEAAKLFNGLIQSRDYRNGPVNILFFEEINELPKEAN